MPFGPRLQISSLFKHRSIIFYEELDNFEINHRSISPASFKGIENKEATEASSHQFRPQISFLQASVLNNTLDYLTRSLLIVAKRKKKIHKNTNFFVNPEKLLELHKGYAQERAEEVMKQGRNLHSGNERTRYR